MTATEQRRIDTLIAQIDTALKPGAPRPRFSKRRTPSANVELEAARRWALDAGRAARKGRA